MPTTMKKKKTTTRKGLQRAPKPKPRQKDPEPAPDAPLNVRIPRSLLNQLRLVCVERKARGLEPATQKDVVVAALLSWFSSEEAC